MTRVAGPSDGEWRATESASGIRIEELVYGGANGALKIAHDMPAEFWEKLK